ncbi:4-hydroxy-tetrahydrodipicolinate synthase [Alteromonas aestuariivivens]|uniref:4-hydroxy-tetrahydrodipicolinate synthase n=1 Tax=Alteromonas aestuariivivens TaxID=1938339 RepID=A0A3D8MAN4_9ALTE|nr:4-hydroxy-tetrahydrodipicolinate synthase [Alteromonas aestuariivivens]RDV27318.1 4-hydroxy-tetrahydrodipicolinate synthase [Alteromonas aestuariivivens]
MFTGSYVALITPMNDQGEIDYAALEKLVQFHIEQGTHGIVSVGTTGESATLPFEEHIDVVKRTVAMVGGKIPVIAGSGANSTAEAIFLSEQMAGLGVDGFLSVVPYYNKPQQAGMIAHFNAIADATDVPVLLYNVPGRTVADMLPETVAELAKHKNIVGLKDATGDIDRLKQTQALVEDDFLLLSGDDASSCEFLCEGGHGVISVTANLVPNAMARMCDAALNKEFDQCRRINSEIELLHDALFVEPNPVMPKWALYKMGLIQSAVLRLPMVLPELASQKHIEDILKQYQMISG